MSVEAGVRELEVAVRRLVTQVAHWQESRWATPATPVPAGPGARPGDTDAAGPGARPGDPDAVGPGAGAEYTRADQLYALAQRLADLAAEAAGEPRRTVPRLDDRVLPDQLRVLADDLAVSGAPPETCAQVAGQLDTLRRAW